MVTKPRWRTDATMALRRPSTPDTSTLSSDLRSSGRDIETPGVSRSARVQMFVFEHLMGVAAFARE
jgi:hypothetical protein